MEILIFYKLGMLILESKMTKIEEEKQGGPDDNFFTNLTLKDNLWKFNLFWAQQD